MKQARSVAQSFFNAARYSPSNFHESRYRCSRLHCAPRRNSSVTQHASSLHSGASLLSGGSIKRTGGFSRSLTGLSEQLCTCAIFVLLCETAVKSVHLHGLFVPRCLSFLLFKCGVVTLSGRGDACGLSRRNAKE